ncbi:hypothetical protein M422DRAFT_239419 [Sphaerobolus stellatus SS14]|nr:hypothetical protein M422DRAFT_239419 [Sphaerobolus stellatus SS14]
MSTSELVSNRSTKPWIYINGHPGIGKLTIARELQKLIPNSKIVHNHLIIDLCRNIFQQGSPEYEALRTTVRTQILTSMTSSASRFTTTYLFTGSHMTAEFNPIGGSVALQHSTHAVDEGVPFISVILRCDEEEHLKRATMEERQGKKLTDLTKIKAIRGMDVFRFWDVDGVKEIELDVTKLQPAESAKIILQLVDDKLP